MHCVMLTGCGPCMTIQATANPVVRGVVVSGANVLPQREIEEAFGDQFGKTLNFPAFSASLRRLNRWYEDRGIFGQVHFSCRALPLAPPVAGFTTAACARAQGLPLHASTLEVNWRLPIWPTREQMALLHADHGCG